MKYVKIMILALILTNAVQADPPRRHHDRPHRSHYYNYYRSPNYHWNMRYYSPVVIRSYTQTTTTSPQNLVTLTADVIAEDIMHLNNMLSQGLLSEKEFTRSKKTLLNRIGMSINPNAAELSTDELLDQIEILHQMQVGQLITKKEFKEQKIKLLAML